MQLNMKSKFLQLNRKDFFNGLIIAVGSAILAYLFEVIQLGSFDTFEWKTILSVSLIATITYLSKNLFRNSEGEYATKETTKIPDKQF